MKTILNSYLLGNIEIFHITDGNTVGMVMLPKGMKPDLSDNSRRVVEPMVQVKLVGDSYPGAFGNGSTMRNSGTAMQLQVTDTKLYEEGDHTTLLTMLSGESINIEYQLVWPHGHNVLESRVKVTNTAKERVGLEMLSSFSLGMLSPLQSSYEVGTVRLHRLRSRWCQEAHHESYRAEELLLTPQTLDIVDPRTEKFGQLGNKTTGYYNPLAAVEDTKNNVFWAAQLAIDGSWQMEFFNKDETIGFSGGIADHDFGHWMKYLEPGESFEAPTAYLTTCTGDFDEACYNLTSIQRDWEKNYPAVEQDLPVMYNEWCTTWACFTREDLLRQIEALKGKGITYFVIDAGWYKGVDNDWSEMTGDWIPDKEKFPNGIQEITKAIRDAGMVPGIWCEIETCAKFSEAFHLKEHLLTKFGKQIVSNYRKYWDFRDPWVTDYLNTRLVDLLDKAGFGYLKIDSNECTGVGCDGAESMGEGLRQHLAAFFEFERNMQKRLPELVVENCSSGGMRVTPKQSQWHPIFSGSDSFECTSGPIVFANNHYVAQPRQNLVWCTLRSEDDIQKLIFKLAEGFLGRICLSGSIADLAPDKAEIITDAISKYRKAVDVIKNGKSHRLGTVIKSYTTPNGWQAVVRESLNSNEVMVVLHTFDVDVPDTVTIELPHSVSVCDWNFKPDYVEYSQIGNKLSVKGLKPDTGCVLMLK